MTIALWPGWGSEVSWVFRHPSSPFLPPLFPDSLVSLSTHRSVVGFFSCGAVVWWLLNVILVELWSVFCFVWFLLVWWVSIWWKVSLKYAIIYWFCTRLSVFSFSCCLCFSSCICLYSMSIWDCQGCSGCVCVHEFACICVAIPCIQNIRSSPPYTTCDIPLNLTKLLTMFLTIVSSVFRTKMTLGPPSSSLPSWSRVTPLKLTFETQLLDSVHSYFYHSIFLYDSRSSLQRVETLYEFLDSKTFCRIVIHCRC